MMNLDMSFVLWEWVFRLPDILVYVAGLVLAFTYREQHPKVSCLVTGACVLGILLVLFTSMIINMVIRLMPFEFARNGIIFFQACLGSVTCALLLWAAFIDRRKDGL